MTTDGLYRALGAALKSALEMVTGFGVELQLHPGAPSDDIEGNLWWRQGCTVGGVASEVSIGAPASFWKFIGEPGDEAGSKEIYFEALTQATLRVLDDLQREISTPIVPQQSGETKSPAARVHCCVFKAHCGQAEGSSDLCIVIDGVLIRAIEKFQGAASPAAEMRRESLGNLSAAVGGYRAEKEKTPEPITERILDISLPASIRIAQTVMPIREVLRLTPGAVVELGKYSGEPVEVVVHGTVLARGELVSVKGYYGVRITEVVTQSERLAAFGAPQKPQDRGALVLSA